MAGWLELKYLNILSTQLERFKSTSRGVWNFRCPICLDSTKSKFKARGYVYEQKGELKYHCHNCEITLPFGKFLRTVDQNVYDEYNRERYLESSFAKEIETNAKEDIFKFQKDLQGLRRISSLGNEHPTRKYIENRLIPQSYYDKLYHCSKFKSWVNGLVPQTFENTHLDGPRLIIPFFYKEQMHAFQGRSIGNSNVKYITMVLNHDLPKIFGLDLYDPNFSGYVVEGPIDSMFLPNAVATAGGDITAGIRMLNTEKLTVVYDNEPRNIFTVNKMIKAVKHGLKVCIWPKHITQKDINDMIMSGKSNTEIKTIIDDNSFKGLQAELAISNWRKVSDDEIQRRRFN